MLRPPCFSAEQTKSAELGDRAVGSAVGGAHSAADERQHENQGHDPEVECHRDVVVHGPPEAGEGVGERAATDVVVLGEEHGAGDDGEDELEHASDEGAVDGADSPSVPPGTDEHEERVKSDDAEGGTHELSDDGETRAELLAVHVTVFLKVKERLLQVSSQLLLVPADLTTDSELNVPRVGAEGRALLVDAPGTTARLGSLKLPVAHEGTIFIGLGRERVVGRLVVVVALGRARIIVFGANVPAAPEVTEGSTVLLLAVQGWVGIASSGRS